eukprot:CAMPEP_0198289210 /NCGR_PEP_ID=MMETSP1449-20131203/7481_1 /TAXON_ID=420275 /ORGANISM="Attheya septentrionalis, Strain CCMP2084" /LENGTH=506 /DNA_ID=CAMNT_0043987507 /DNA_START=202 /DNA_END=1722 /DNA_ORIENTATION=-
MLSALDEFYMSSFKPRPEHEYNVNGESSKQRKEDDRGQKGSYSSAPPSYSSSSSSSKGPNRFVDGIGSCSSSNKCALTEKCVQGCAAYGHVCPCDARAAGQYVEKALMDLSKDSKLFACKPDYPTYECSDLLIGWLLGEGGYSEVHDVTIKPERDNDNDNTRMDTKSEGQEYAIKFLQRQAMVDRDSFKRGAADLAIEARFLSTLSHPHIVTLHGVTAGSVESNVATGKECGFFIIIDRLYDPLDRRISIWHESAVKYNTLFYRARHDLKGYKRKAMLMERLEVASKIADAMRYLHSLNITHRDLKPDNIGFDACDTVKLFDFGLAKELRESEKLEDGNYKLTGMTGSRRYMAPEVAKRLSYNQSADVYSFGILLYEICSLERPFQGYPCTRHMEEIVMGKQRPKIETGGCHSFWPESLVALIRKSWDDNAHVRPNFNEVMESLNQLLSRTTEPSNENEKDTMEEDIVEKTDMSPKPPLLSNIKLPKRRRAYSWGGLKNGSRTESE